MKNSVILFLFLHLALTININSQVNQEWVTRYNGTGNISDEAHSIAVDDSGNVYVTGHSFGSGTFNDYGTVKYNSAGNQQWISRYNGPGNDYDEARSIAADYLGNIFVTGFSYGNGTHYDYATIKYNSSGVQQWVKRYNGPGNDDDAALSIAVDYLGNVYVTGLSHGSGTAIDYATIKYNTFGIQQWVARYNGPGNSIDAASSLSLDATGNVYVTGTSVGIGTGEDYATIKYNPTGVQQWVARYNGPSFENDWPNSIAVDTSGNVYVTGQTITQTSNDYSTIKYNSSGVQQWAVRYNGTGNSIDEGISIAVDGSENVYVTGYSLGSGTAFDYATIKYNVSGDSVWVRRYNGPGYGSDMGSSIAVDGSGNVYVTGYSLGSGTNYDYATIKYNVFGDSVWVRRYNGPGSGEDYSNSIVVDGFGNVYVTGYGPANGTDNDYATIKYSQPIGITPLSNQIPANYFLSQNYPNPFNPSTKIKFEIPLLRGVSEGRGVLTSLNIFDVLGREVETLVNERLNAGTYEVEWNATNYPSGVYYYKLIAGDPSSGSGQAFADTKKMVLVK